MGTFTAVRCWGPGEDQDPLDTTIPWRALLDEVFEALAMHPILMLWPKQAMSREN